MKAIVCTKYGPPDGLQLREVKKPTPKDRQVLVQVHATTVTSGDVILRGLKFPLKFVLGLVFGHGKSRILGHELAGVVQKVGRDVTRFRPGDQVFASTGNRAGAYAEYISLPEDGMVAEKPANMTYEQAAAVPIGANTALHILRKADIQSGQQVLVYGASGSVGTYAVQLAKHFGAQVTGVCSTTNLELAKSIGADKVIDYTREDLTENGELYDVVFDAVAKLEPSDCQASLKKGGLYLSVRSPTREKTENLVFLRELIEADKIRAVIDRRYPLEKVAEAHRYVQAGHKKGNVVITVAQGSEPDKAPH